MSIEIAINYRNCLGHVILNEARSERLPVNEISMERPISEATLYRTEILRI